MHWLAANKERKAKVEAGSATLICLVFRSGDGCALSACFFLYQQKSYYSAYSYLLDPDLVGRICRFLIGLLDFRYFSHQKG